MLTTPIGGKRVPAARRGGGAAALALAISALASLLLPIPAAATPIDVLLSQRPFTPTDRSLFSPLMYPDAPPLVPASGGELTEEQARARVAAYLAVQFPGDAAAQAEGLALFDDPVARQKISSPTLRAGLVGLKGTFAESAIDFILNAQTSTGLPKITDLRFDGPTLFAHLPSTAIAGSIQDGATGQGYFVFNPKYIAEDPFLLTRVIAHEAIHPDAVGANFEEIINLTLDMLVYFQQLASHPELALTGTELARRHNSNALALLNSGADSEIGLFDANGPILPGSLLGFTSWFDQFDELPNLVNSPGNPLLGEYLDALFGPGQPCSAAEFSLSLLMCIDQNLGAFPDETVLAAARNLLLAIPGDSSVAVAEPGSLALLGGGLIAFATLVRRRRQRF